VITDNRRVCLDLTVSSHPSEWLRPRVGCFRFARQVNRTRGSSWGLNLLLARHPLWIADETL